jgi:uncharacterized protein YkwD
MLTRRLAVALMAAVCAVTAPVAAPIAHASSAARLTASEMSVIRLMNQVRARHGLPALKASPRLARAADGHSRDMLRHDFFAHPSSDGTPFDARVRSYAPARRVGENLAMLGGVRRAARKVVRMWLSSAAHRQILLSRGFRRVGVGTRSGRLGGHVATVYTVDFASRR